MYEPKYDPSYYEDEKERDPLIKLFAIAGLCLELAVGVISIITFDGFEECCGGYFFMADSSDGQDKWDKAVFWIAVGYVGVVVIEMLLHSKEWPLGVCNPLVGFCLNLASIYSSNSIEAYIMYALQTAAVFTRSYVFIKDRRYSSLFLQSLLGFFASGFVLYIIISLTIQGGYCVVGDFFETMLQKTACNTDCDDVDIPCSVCDYAQKSCFIEF